MLTRLLLEDSIRIGLEAATREGALEAMLGMLTDPDLDRKKILSLLLEREKFGTTAIGEGLALPHCFDAEISSPVVLLGISRQGISFPSLDGNPIHILFMLLLPEREESKPLKARILKEAENLFRDRFLKERLKISETAGEAHEIILREAHYQKSESRTVKLSTRVTS